MGSLEDMLSVSNQIEDSIRERKSLYYLNREDFLIMCEKCGLEAKYGKEGKGVVDRLHDEGWEVSREKAMCPECTRRKHGIRLIKREDSALFTHRNHDKSLAIVYRFPCEGDLDKAIKMYCIGWCYSADTLIPDNGKLVALMFRDEMEEVTWFHCPFSSFMEGYELEGLRK